jgi:hypothetical protein
VVTGDIDAGAVEDLITLCVQYHGTRAQAAAGAAPGAAAPAALAMLEHQILGKVIQVVSGPGGVASFLRRTLLGKGLNGPSLPLDAGQTDDIPVHLRRLAALRDQTCQFPGGCDQPAAGCEPHHVLHRQDGGRTSLTNLKDYCSLKDPCRAVGGRLACCGRYVTCPLRDVHCAGCCWRSTVSAPVIVIAGAPPGAASHCPLTARPFSEVQNQFCGAGGCPGRMDRQQGLALRAPHSELTTASRFRQ